MLNEQDFLKKFKTMQEPTVEITRLVAQSITPGMTELEVSERYEAELAKAGLKEHWYPILICAGEFTAKPISRRFHLPSADVVVQENDIIMLDATPIDGTVWSNWAETFVVGHDDFFEQLIKDAKTIVDHTHTFATEQAKTIGDILDFCLSEIKVNKMKSLDSRDDVGHSIFQVPEGQSVDKTPVEDRLFMNEDYRDYPIQGILSIEPQVGRINPTNGKMYGAKIQKVLLPS